MDEVLMVPYKCCCFSARSAQRSYFLINHFLRNLTFNRSANSTQVSDQCPLGLLFHRDINEFKD